VLANHAHSARLLIALVSHVSQLQNAYQTSFLELEITALLVETAQLQLSQIQIERTAFYHQSQIANALRDTPLMDSVALLANMDNFHSLMLTKHSSKA